MKRKVCVRCINDSTVKNIAFDDNGVCNFCRAYDDAFEKLHDYQNLQKLFEGRLERIKGKHAYDAAVGFSGGKDSAYVLYKAVKDYGLKVKAFTLDNGFLSAEARINIDAVVKALGIEHEYITFDRKLLKNAYKYTTTKYLSPCIACSYLGYAAMISYTSKIDAGLCLHGRSFSQMFRNFIPEKGDSFLMHIQAGLEPAGVVDLTQLYDGARNDMNKYFAKKLVVGTENIIMPDILANGYREFVAYFLYHKYDKNEIINFVESVLPWAWGKDKEHFDCTIHNAAAYIKNITARRPHIMNELSVSVREKLITREDALRLLEDSRIDCPNKELDMMCKTMGVGKKRLIFKAKLYSKRWW